MANSIGFCLKMSGIVLAAKQKEFEQTLRFVSNHLGPDCLQFSFSSDIFISGLYHFYSLWPTTEALSLFFKSQEFNVLEGAYKTLGSLEKFETGEVTDIKVFHITASA